MPRDGSSNRQRILDAAERLVLRRGFSGTALDEVIGAAGTSKGAFFHHFPSKRELARTLLDRHADHLVALLLRAHDRTASVDDPVERVDAFLGELERSAARPGSLAASALAEHELLGAAAVAPVQRAAEASRAVVLGLLRAAAAARPAAHLDAEAWADHVFVTLEGAQLLARATGGTEHLREQLGVLRTAVAAVLASGPSAPGGVAEELSARRASGRAAP